MKTLRRVAVVSCGLLILLTATNATAQTTRMTLSQYRAAQARAAQSRSAPRIAPTRIIRPVTRYTTPSRQTSTRNATSAASTPTTTRAASENELKVFQDKIPEAALASDRGIELVTRLKSLRYSEATLGSKHPSMVEVRKQIVSIKRELKKWESGDDDTLASEAEEEEASDESLATTKTNAKPDASVASDRSATDKLLDGLSETELRRLVVRLSQDITKLRDRVAELESTNVTR